MALITDLPAAATVASTDVFIKDTGSATNKITGTDLATQLLGLGNITTVTTGVVTISTTGFHVRNAIRHPRQVLSNC